MKDQTLFVNRKQFERKKLSYASISFQNKPIVGYIDHFSHSQFYRRIGVDRYRFSNRRQEKSQRRYGNRERSRIEANLSEDPSPLDFLHEIGADFPLQDVVEETAEQLAIVFEALERNFLRDIVRRIRHRVEKGAIPEKAERRRKITLTVDERPGEGKREENSVGECEGERDFFVKNAVQSSDISGLLEMGPTHNFYALRC